MDSPLITNKKTQITAPEGFSLTYFCYRYIAGLNSLRESRSVSRKRLALATSGIESNDFEAFQLHMQIERFSQSVDYLSSQSFIGIEDLCYANKLLAPNTKNAGKIRLHQNWVGPSLKKAVYLPPPPDKLEEPLKKLIENLNDTQMDSMHNICESHSTLLMIHPFTDGNGRCARALFESKSQKNNIWEISPFVFRLIIGDKKYISATRSFGIDNYAGTEHPFWNESLTWSGQASTKIAQELKATTDIISSKTLFSFSIEMGDFIKFCWSSPIFTFNKLLTRFNNNIAITIATIDHFLKSNLITIKKTSQSQEVIYEFDLIMDCYLRIENILLENGNHDK